MKDIDSINSILSANESAALAQLKSGIRVQYPDADIVLFGSLARGEADTESDIDVLILIDRPVDDAVRSAITDVSYQIELEYDVVFGKIVENRETWNSPRYHIMPLHRNVEMEGVLL